jgi:hypothetical protein
MARIANALALGNAQPAPRLAELQLGDLGSVSKGAEARHHGCHAHASKLALER